MQTSEANPSPTNDHQVRDAVFACCGFVAAVIFTVIFTVAFLISLLTPEKIKLPRFDLHSVSVDIHTTAVEWDIGFSIDSPVGDKLYVWVRFMGRDYKVESVGIAGNATVSVTTPPLPRGFDLSSRRLTLEKVMFACNHYIHYRYAMEAVCKDIVAVVGFNSTSTTHGVMMGGPRVCPQL